ncbi:uncharacterized protein LOC144598634 [Rhinoraja longicauda]
MQPQKVEKKSMKSNHEDKVSIVTCSCVGPVQQNICLRKIKAEAFLRQHLAGNASTHRLQGVTECPRCLGNANRTTIVTNEDIHRDWYDEPGQQIEGIISHKRKACVDQKLSPSMPQRKINYSSSLHRPGSNRSPVT